VEMSVSVHSPLVRVPDAIVREALAQVDLRKPVASVHEGEEEEEEESARGEISDSDEDYNFSGPWVSKGNPTEFLDSESGEILDRWGNDWMVRRRRRMTEHEWKNIADFLLAHTVSFVD